MAQNYTEQLRKDNVRDAIYEDLQNNCEVLRTSWSGNAFPANPKVGQPCYRVDEDKLYYWDGYKWSQKGGGGSAELKTMELAAATSERVSITLEGARCLDKNMMFVFVDKIAQDPSTYSMNDDGTVVNFNPAIPANAAVTLRWFDTDVGTFDTAIFASDAEFAAGELTNKAPNVKQVHSLSDMVASKLSGLELMDVVFAPLGIDESKNKRRYLNGQVIIQEQFPAFTAAVKARMSTMANAFTTETNWQAEKTNSKLGQCGKFVVDDTAGTIRLPKVVNIQGLQDLSLLGGIKAESLPNVKGDGHMIDGGSGCFTTGEISKFIRGGDAAAYQCRNITFDASLSSSTYQNNAPVQQEAIQYPYCIVVNTGIEETDRPINNYQVNNVYSYGMSQYYKGTMNNNSWLKSAGQWNDGTVYTGMYNWLLEQMNAGVSGFVASTAAYTDYDFVINTANQTFRLPLLNGEEDWVGNETSVLSSADIVKDSPFQWTATKNGFVKFTCYKEKTTQVVIARINGQTLIHSGVATATTTPRPGFWLKVRKGDTISISAESQTLSAVSITFIPAVGNGSLYYYIGDTLQNAQLINVARIEEKLTDMNATSRGYLVDSYHNGTEWYRIYSDGWIEQGGRFYNNADVENTISFLKPFKNTDYSLLINHGVSGKYATALSGRHSDEAWGYTTTNFQAQTYNAVGLNWIVWSACGY